MFRCIHSFDVLKFKGAPFGNQTCQWKLPFACRWYVPIQSSIKNVINNVVRDFDWRVHLGLYKISKSPSSISSLYYHILSISSILIILYHLYTIIYCSYYLYHLYNLYHLYRIYIYYTHNSHLTKALINILPRRVVEGKGDLSVTNWIYLA